jgi:hypothetical protein
MQFYSISGLQLDLSGRTSNRSTSNFPHPIIQPMDTPPEGGLDDGIMDKVCSPLHA